MGLLKELILLPAAPIRGTIAVAGLVHDAAAREFYDPNVIREQLEEVDRQRSIGALSDEAAAAIEAELIDRLLAGPQGHDV